MASTKISDLISASSVAAADLFTLVQSGANKKVTAPVMFGSGANGDLAQYNASGLLAPLTPGTGVSTLLAGTPSGTDGLVGINSPTLTGVPAAPTASQGTNTTQIATTAFVTTAVSSAVTGLLEFKGSTDCSANPNYPAASAGDSYVVSVAGKIGGASGTAVDAGDVYLATADNAGGTQAAVGSSWTVLEHNLAGALLAANNLSDVSSAATARTNLGLGTGNSPQFTAIELGHADDTTITRVSAGVAAIEGSTILVSGGALGTPASGTLTNCTGYPTNMVYPTLYTATDGATVTFNMNNSRRQIVTLGGNRTLALSNDVDGMPFILILKQDGTGSRTVTWWSGIKWAGGSPPTLTTTAGKYDIVSFIRIASGEYLGCIVQNF